MKYFNNIPGMIEPIEQEMLQLLCQSINLDKNDTLVEYGAFFGRSTKCILEGLKNNKSYASTNNLIIYDSFKCNINGGFSKYVKSFAKQGNVENLLLENNSIINFRKVFENYILPAKISLQINECELSQIKPIYNSISFMHIDCPKYYAEFKHIIDNHFLYLKKDSFIIFQDFFYHWSATLIAAVEILLQEEYFEIQRSAASSLCVRVKKIFSKEDINNLDLKMNSLNLNGIINNSINRIILIEAKKIDRIHQFLPRLILSSIQHYWEKSDFVNAEYLWRNFLVNYPEKLQPVFDDFHDLMRHGFSIRSLYEIDHNISL